MLANYARWYTFLPPQWSTIPPPLTFFLVCEVFPTVICARDASGDREYYQSGYPFGDPVNVEKPFAHYCEESQDQPRYDPQGSSSAGARHPSHDGSGYFTSFTWHVACPSVADSLLFPSGKLVPLLRGG